MPSKAKNTLTLEGERTAISGLLTQGEDNHWQIGVHYNNVVDKGLATQAGYKTAVEFFSKELKQVAQSTLSLYGSVAKSFSEATAKKYGCTKLGLLLTYQTQSHASPAKGDPGAVLIQVPQKSGTAAAQKFADCSVADLNLAIKRLKGPPQLPHGTAKQVAAIQRALDAAVGKGKIDVKVHLRGHTAVLQLGAFDVALASTVADALKAH